MNKTIVIIASYLLALPVMAALGPKSVFQVRAVSDRTSTTNNMQVFWAQGASGHKDRMGIKVEKTVLMDDSDLKSAVVKASNSSMGPYIVWITLSRKGKERFEEVTRDHLNQEIVIMVEGKIVSAPFLRSVMHTDSLPLGRFHTRDDAAKVAQRLEDVIHR